MATAIQKIILSSARDIPFNKLVLSQSNVRRVKAGVSIEELAESIARRGLIQSLHVRPVLDAFDAAAAERFGVVNRVVDDDALDAATQDWVQRLAAKPEWALHMTKTQFRAYGRSAALGDVTEGDCDLLGMASSQDPGRFVFPRGGG